MPKSRPIGLGDIVSSDPSPEPPDRSGLRFPVGWFEFDGNSGTTVLDVELRDWLGLVEPAVDRETFASFIAPEDLGAYDRAVAEALATTGSGEFDHEFRLVGGELAQPRWIHALADRVGEPGEAPRLVGTMQDVSREIEAARRSQLVARELEHRISNVLGAAHAIIGLSRAGATDIDEYHNVLRARIRALAGAQELLLRSDWSATPLADILATAQESFVGSTSEQLRMSGDAIVVPARHVTTFFMAFHELLTNSARHGALGDPEGRIEVLTAQGTEQTSLTWFEDGVAVRPLATNREGFGMVLLLESLPGELGGRGRISTEHGFRYSLIFPSFGALG